MEVELQHQVLVPVPLAPPEPPPGPPPLPPPPPVDPVADDDAVQPVDEHLTMVIARPLSPGFPAGLHVHMPFHLQVVSLLTTSLQQLELM